MKISNTDHPPTFYLTLCDFGEDNIQGNVSKCVPWFCFDQHNSLLQRMSKWMLTMGTNCIKNICINKYVYTVSKTILSTSRS